MSLHMGVGARFDRRVRLAFDAGRTSGRVPRRRMGINMGTLRSGVALRSGWWIGTTVSEVKVARAHLILTITN